MAWTQSDLDAIDAAIQAKIAGGAIQSYAVGNRNVQHMRVDELLRLRKFVAEEVDKPSRSSDVILARTIPS